MLARARELADESGSIVARGYALSSSGDLATYRGQYAEAKPLLEEARVLFEESGVASALGRVLYRLSVVAWHQEDIDGAERLSRESIRTLLKLEDRGTLCEAQRQLAETLLLQGKLDEAERYAEAALETVGAQDMSSQASTRYTLARVRRAQGRLDEAEKLLREAVGTIDETEYREFGSDSVRALAQLLRERGDAEAEVFERRLADFEAADSRAARIA
jgi:tetratricopeptide (TPR) repeat protein